MTAPQPDRSSRLVLAEEMILEAARLCEVVGVTDPEQTRNAGVLFRLAQRVAVDSGRLDRAA